MREPREADGLPDVRAGCLLELEPLQACVPCELGIPIDIAVREPQEAGVAARCRPDRARRVLLDERNVPAAECELSCGCCAEDAGADDGRATHPARLLDAMRPL